MTFFFVRRPLLSNSNLLGRVEKKKFGIFSKKVSFPLLHKSLFFFICLSILDFPLPQYFQNLKTNFETISAQRHREKWVKVAEARILQEELAECFMREGVNHIQNCKHLAKQYFELIHSPDFGIRKL